MMVILRVECDYMDIYSKLSSQYHNKINMSSERKQCCLALNGEIFWTHINRSLLNCNPDLSFEDMTQKIKNSICYILQICDAENLEKSTKYLAICILLRYLGCRLCSSDEQLGLLILCCLKLAAKMNEVEDKTSVFDKQSYIELMQISRSIQQIHLFQFQVFKLIGFKIYFKSPYEYLDQLCHGRFLPENFYHAVTAYIDFSLTLMEVVSYSAEEIFAACLLALKKTRKITNKGISGLIEEVQGRFSISNQLGDIIIQAWKNILEEQQQ